MTTFISRDYSPVTSGYINQPFGGSYAPTATARFYITFMYQLSIFLHKILGYSVVGQTNWNIDNTNIQSLIVTAATNSIPIQITTAAAHGLSDGDTVCIQNGTGNVGVNGTWKVSVINSTQATLIGSYGTGAYSVNTATLTTGFLYTSGLVSDGFGTGINNGFGTYTLPIPITKRYVLASDVGRMLALRSTTNPTKNSGIFKINAINQGNTTTVTSASNGAVLPQSTINVTSTTGFPTSGTIYINTGTTIAAGSNGAILPQATINVASTSGFPTSGTIYVTTSAGVQVVSYTGTNLGTQFTGCTGGTGTMSTGGAVIGTSPTQTITYTGGGGGGTQFTGCSGGVGTLATGSPVTNFNGYTIDYRSTDTPPTENGTIDWWLYETETVASGFLSKFGFTSSFVSQTTNASPIVVTTDTNFPHTWITGQQVFITGNPGNTAANGTWTITQVSSTQFSLNGSVGNGTGGGGTAYLVGYPGGGTSNNSRVIFQSPHSAAWQVRICAEPDTNLDWITITVGYGGNSSGDFPVGSPISNIVMSQNINPTQNTQFNNISVGAGTAQTASRITMVGDNTGQAVCIYTRTLGATNNGFTMFGISDNEPTPLPDNQERLFCYGSSSLSDYGTIILRTGTATNVGNAIRRGAPRFAALTGWANLDGTSATSPLLSATAGDSVFSGMTEVLPVEVWGGTVTDAALGIPGTNPQFTYDQRFMGTAPMIRIGRTNFTAFALSTENTASFSVTSATNTSPIQITTSAANPFTTGQTVVIFGATGNTAANGTFVVTVIDSQNFTLNGTTGNGTFSGTATVNGCPRWLHLQNGIYLAWNGAAGLTP